MRPISASRIAVCLGVVIAAHSAAAQGLVTTNIASLPYRAFAHAWDPARRALYLSDREGHRVQRLAPDGSVVASWTAADTQFPEALAFSPDRKRIVVALPARAHDPFLFTGQAGAVAVLDADTLAPVRTLPLALDPFDVALFDDGRVAVSGGSGQFTSVLLFGPDSPDSIGNLGVRQLSYLVPSVDGTRLYASDTDQNPPSVRRFEPNAGGLADSGREYDGGLPPRSRPEPRPDGAAWVVGGGDLLALSAAGASDLARVGTLASDPGDTVLFDATVWDTARSLLLGASTSPDTRLRAYRSGTFLPVGSWTLDRPVTGLFLDGAELGGLVREPARTWIVRLPHLGPDVETNRPPDVRLVVVDAPLTFRMLTFDASGSTDDSTPAAGLRYRWDWDGDGTYDTAFTTTPFAVQRYFTTGRHEVRVQVRDRFGATAAASVAFDVAPAADEGVPGKTNAPFRLGFAAAGVAFDGSRHRAYVSDAAAGEVAAVDLDTGLEVRRWSVPGVPERMAVTHDSTRLYVALPAGPHEYSSGPPDGSIAEFDLVQGELLRILPVQTDPWDIAATDDGTLLVSSGSNQTAPLDAYRLSDGARTQRVLSHYRLRFLPDPDGKSVWALTTDATSATQLRLDLLPASTFVIGYQKDTDPLGPPNGFPIGFPIGGHRLVDAQGRILSADNPATVLETPGDRPALLLGAVPVGGGWVAATTAIGVRYLAAGAASWLPWSGVPEGAALVGPVGDRHGFAVVGTDSTTFLVRSLPALDPSTNHPPQAAWPSTAPIAFVPPGSVLLRPTFFDEDGYVVSAEVWLGTSKLADLPLRQPVYAASLGTPGTNDYFIVAHDNLGGVATSAVQRVIGRLPPSVVWAGPAVIGVLPGATTDAQVNVTPGDGPVVRVEIGIETLSSVVPLAVTTDAPWHGTLPPVSEDTTFVAVAYDELGIPSAATYLTLHADGTEGDDFYRPFALSGSAPRDTRSNRGATRQPNEPIDRLNVIVGHSLWWRWTAPSNGIVTVSTVGSTIDTYVAVYTGNVLGLGTPRLQVSSQDGPGGSPAGVAKLRVFVGTDYWILIDSPFVTAGDVSVAIDYALTLPTVPANDQFVNRALIPSLPARYDVDTTGATTEQFDQIGLAKPGFHSVWWEWVAPSDGIAAFTTAGSEFDTLLKAYGVMVSGPSITLTTLGLNDDLAVGDLTSRVIFAVTNGQHVAVSVDGFQGASGHAVLNGTFVPATGALPPNDDFANATALDGLLARVPGTTAGATAEPGESGAAGLGTVWWRWTAPRSAQVLVTTDPAMFAVSAWTGSAVTDLTEVVYRTGQKLTGRAVFSALAGRTYWVRVASVPAVPFVLTLDATLPAGKDWSVGISTTPAGGLVLGFAGPSRSSGVLQSSTDLQAWQDVVRRNWTVGETYPLPAAGESVFYRLILDQ